MVTEWSAPSFQIQFRALDGSHRTLDGVRPSDLASAVLERIANKLGLSEASRLRLLHAGKQLEPTAACGLSKGDTVHLVSLEVGRLGGWCMQNSVCCVPSVPRTISLDWTMIAVFRVRRAACIVGFVLYERT